MGAPVVRLRDVSVVFRPHDPAPITALQYVGLDVTAGERVAISGPNGSGKTTLLHVIAGLQPTSNGSIEILGANPANGELPAEIRRRVGVVLQHAEDMFAQETVREELHFALRCAYPDDPRETAEIDDLLRARSLDHLADRKLNTLSGGERQQVALASVLVVRPEVLLLDEPTTNLDPPGRREFVHHDIFGDANTAKTIIMVTQHWDEVKSCDRVLVLDQAQIAYDGTPAEYSHAEKHTPAVTIDIPKTWLHATAAPTSDPLVVVENLSQTETIFPAELPNPLQDISFSIQPGEIVGIVGPTGSGKSTLAWHLAGLIRKFKGGITVAGKPVNQKNHRPPVAMLMQQPERQLFADTVFDDVAFGPKNIGIPKAAIPNLVRDSLQLTGLSADDFGHRSPFELSGGEQRKAGLAGILALPASLYILDEPTSYLDPESVARMEGLIHNLTSHGNSVIVITHDLEFIKGNVQRILFIDKGQLIFDGSASEELPWES